LSRGGAPSKPPELRPFGLVLHHDGSWTHEGQPIEHRRLREAFDRGVRYLPGEGASYEIEETRDENLEPRHTLLLRMPDAFEAQRKLAVEAQWHQPDFASQAIGKVEVSTPGRHLERGASRGTRRTRVDSVSSRRSAGPRGLASTGAAETPASTRGDLARGVSTGASVRSAGTLTTTVGESDVSSPWRIV